MHPGNKLRPLALAASLALAGPTAAEVSPLLLAGAAIGGDTLVATTARDLDAGGLIYLGAGVLVTPSLGPMRYQFTLGYKFDSVSFTDGDSSLRVFPLDAVAFYSAGKVQIGAGVSYYLNPTWELCVDDIGCGTLDFDDALGGLVEIRYHLPPRLFFGLRYTAVNYTATGGEIDASNLRLHAGWLLGP